MPSTLSGEDEKRRPAATPTPGQLRTRLICAMTPNISRKMSHFICGYAECSYDEVHSVAVGKERKL